MLICLSAASMWTSWEVLGLGVDAALTYVFYRLYKDAIREGDLIKGLSVYEPGSNLKDAISQSENQNIAYACVDGVSEAAGEVLKSRYVEGESGLIQVLSFLEHKSKRSQGYWSDAVRVIKQQTNTRPFKIANINGSKSYQVDVQDALLAEYLQESLTTTYDQFEPNQEGLLSKGIDRLFGEVTKGYQEKEEMLGVGIRLLGVGKLTLEGSKIVLSPPDPKVGRYIVSGLSKNQIVSELKSKAKTFKMFVWFCGLVGVGLVAYWIRKNWRSIWEDYQMRRTIRRMRLERRQNGADADAGNNNGDENENRDPCVICLDRPKELIVLDCGHLCLCGECGQALPFPRRCPICRLPVQRLIPVYNA